MYENKRIDLNPARLSVFAFLQLKKLFLETTYKKKNNEIQFVFRTAL